MAAASAQDVTYLPCRGLQDVPALRAFFDELLPAPYPEEFYREAAARSCSGSLRGCTEIDGPPGHVDPREGRDARDGLFRL
jgi:hypothetical protein